MAKMVLITHEVAEFGDLPDEFEQWKYSLGKSASRLYQKLRDGWLDGKVFPIKTIANAVGLSINGAEEALDILQERGFLTLSDDEIPMEIRVHDCPELAEDAETTTARVAELFTPSEERAEVLLEYWAKLYHQRTTMSYGSGNVHKGGSQDRSLAKRLLGHTELATARKVCSYYWANRNEDDPTTFRGFYPRYTDVAAEMADWIERTL